jgi:hypothetical protein
VTAQTVQFLGGPGGDAGAAPTDEGSAMGLPETEDDIPF